MRYFTKDWWASGCPNAEAVFKTYAEHFDRIRPILPERLVELYLEHTLHDACVRNVSSNFSDRSVSIAVDGWDLSFSRKVQYELSFFGVRNFVLALPHQGDGSEEIGELGYWECDTDSDLVRVNLLFTSGAELNVSFEAFGFSARDL